ncbi:hypothetical protein BV25DRAFT_1335487 [Artomyces pyxidatus]|uniref:Uncharacterized protein n=1 Tax=Artomyces pyxidatus TaxID=48021 RepID=A0ACB8SND3_9AGAM|nr:hypothetical protein BV25DRAFT_1335487 [Artomyces pyxidatus]
MKRAYKYYGAPADDPEMSPALYPSHAGLPPAHIQVLLLGLMYIREFRTASKELLLRSALPLNSQRTRSAGSGFVRSSYGYCSPTLLLNCHIIGKSSDKVHFTGKCYVYFLLPRRP